MSENFSTEQEVSPKQQQLIARLVSGMSSDAMNAWITA